MTTERDKMLNTLKIAIEMEKEGKEWYLQESLKAYNESGRLLLEALADDEDEHIQKFEQIYETVRIQKLWPSTDFQTDEDAHVRGQFDRICAALDANARLTVSELEIIKEATDKESKSCDFYDSLATAATCDSEKSFYESLSRKENEHRLVLVDYTELVTDPAAWFLRKERQSLDGG